ncbi:CapA family protein [Bacillus sp. JCM 19041]|uniref:CapA family protein n=1 Tax=Bacillus sp. JCM 19041 TaxID=1460637 RepID=UPI0006D12F08
MSRVDRYRKQKQKKMITVAGSAFISILLFSLLFFTARNDEPTSLSTTNNSSSNAPLIEDAPDDDLIETPEREPFTLAFAGDTMFDWDLRPVLDAKGYHYPFHYVQDEFKEADYSVLNLETAITERTKQTPGQLFWIKSEVASLPALTESGIDLVTLSNNHVLDYGEEGLLDTLNALDEHELAYIGAGRNTKEAYEAEVIELNDQTIAFVSFSRFFPDSNWVAGPDKPGVTNGYDLDHVIDVLQQMHSEYKPDYLISFFHWGVEQTYTPAKYQFEYVERIANETETTAIIGTHPHWLQGFHYQENVFVAYSLGNFLFPDYVSGPSAETGVLHLTFDGEGNMSAQFSPYIIQDNQIVPLEGKSKESMYRYLEDISINVVLDQEGRIVRE